MNDNFHEQLITKKQKGNPLVIRIIVVVFIILFLTIGALFLGFLSIIIAVVLGVTAYFYIFPNLSVEYEYSLVNHELDITARYLLDHETMDAQTFDHVFTQPDDPELAGYQE